MILRLEDRISESKELSQIHDHRTALHGGSSNGWHRDEHATDGKLQGAKCGVEVNGSESVRAGYGAAYQGGQEQREYIRSRRFIGRHAFVTLKI
jgi:hypothetical protein